MRKLVVFNSVTLDGFFSGPDGDLSWAHAGGDDLEWNAFVSNNAKGGGTLIFGRKTYEMMAAYWPTPEAHQRDPVIAEGMSNMQKIVFSKTLTNPGWKNVTVVKTDPAAEIRRLRSTAGDSIVVLGSGTIVSELTEHRLVDEYQIVVVPVVIGKGRTMFASVSERVPLRLTNTRSFKNGNVLMTYDS